MHVVIKLFQFRPDGSTRQNSHVYLKYFSQRPGVWWVHIPVSGLDLLLVSVPNAVRSYRSTPEEIFQMEADSSGRLESTLGGIVCFTMLSLNIDHLLYISVQRFIAIQFPMYYRSQTAGKVTAHLVFIWVINITISSIPGNHSPFVCNAFLDRYDKIID